MYMRAEAMWKAFADTGDPLCYLLYKAMGTVKAEKEETRGSAAG